METNETNETNRTNGANGADAWKKTGFDAYDLALEIARVMRPLVERIREHDRSLADEATKVDKVWIVERRDGKQVRATRRDGRFAFFAPDVDVKPGPRPHGKNNK